MHPPKLSLLVALLAVGALVAVTAAAHAFAGKSTALRSLRLVEKGGGIRFVDNPPKAKSAGDFSPGDIVIVTRDLTTPAGTAAGTLSLVCVATTATTQNCDGSETLTHGTLDFAGVSSPSRSTTVAVVGGTGTYAGARGTSVSTDRAGNSDIADQTITLLP